MTEQEEVEKVDRDLGKGKEGKEDRSIDRGASTNC